VSTSSTQRIWKKTTIPRLRLTTSLKKIPSSRSSSNFTHYILAYTLHLPRESQIMDVDNREYDWIQESFSYCVTVSKTRKRKAETTLDFSPDFFEFLPVDFKACRVDESRSAHETQAGKKVGNNQDILKKIFSFLPEDSLRKAATISKFWRQIATRTLQKRAGNKPYALLWRNKEDLESFDIDEFVSSARNGEYPLQATLFAATSSLEEKSSDFKSTNFLPGVISSAIFSDRIVVSSPRNNYTTLIDSADGEHGLQALCIPTSNRFHIKSYSIPVWSTDDTGAVVGLDQVSASLRNTIQAPQPMKLKGMTLFQYQDESVVKDLMAQRLDLENRQVSLVGGVVNGMTSNETTAKRFSPSPLACGWAIYGDRSVRVASVALELNSSNENIIFRQIRQHFLGAKNGGFILIVYKSSLENYRLVTDEIRRNVSGIPIVGVETLGDFFFQGNAVTRTVEPVEINYPNPVTSMDKYKVACMMVALD